MELDLKKVGKRPTIIAAFPGFGLVGVIATEFLIDHLKVELIGKHWFESQPATVVIHQHRLIPPVSIYYNKEYNLILVHAISAIANTEWEASNLLLDLSNKTRASTTLMLEGVSSAGGASTKASTKKVFYYSSIESQAKKMESIGIKPLKEGIIIGVTSALMLKSSNVVSLFVETASGLPDSKGAAKLIEVLDRYLNLKVDTTPLLAMAKKFEEKLTGIMQKSQVVKKQQDKKMMSYVG